MSTLWDRLLADRAVRRHLDTTVLRPGSSPVVVLDGTNVGEWFYGGTSQEEWWYDQHFPNVAPPWPAFFVECRRPHQLLTERTDVGELGPEILPYAWGMLVTSERLDTGFWTVCTELFVQSAKHQPASGPWAMQVGQIDPEGLFTIPDDNLIATAQRAAIRSGIDPTIAIAAQDERRRGPIGLTSFNADLPDDIVGPLVQALSALHLPLWLAVCFTHFRNVPTQRVKPSAALSRKWAKRHGAPLSAYTVCDIRPAAAIVDATEAAHHGTNRGGALHIVRGHFKHYDADAPLFGRHTGTWWWADRLAGQAQPGRTIRKDYRST